jgi:hypothetical protein
MLHCVGDVPGNQRAVFLDVADVNRVTHSDIAQRRRTVAACRNPRILCHAERLSLHRGTVPRQMPHASRIG